MTPLTAADGDNIAVLDWPLDDNVRSRGTVLIVHGLGEHAGRHHGLAEWFNAQGFAVRAHDQYGHGQSDGLRGDLPRPARLLDDLADVVDNTRLRMFKNKPLILLGHSMGGLVVAQFAMHGLRRIDGMVLSSPAFDPGLSSFQKFLLSQLLRWMPDLRVGNGLKIAHLCRDKAVVAAYRRDPLVHPHITARLVDWLSGAGGQCIAAAPRWQVPSLLLYAGADKLVNPEGSRAFAQAAPKAVVQDYCFDQMFHEIFNEPDKDDVLAVLAVWLKRFA